MARQSVAWRGHGKSLSERLSASLWREIIWKWRKGHLWNEVCFSLKEKNKREEITRSGCDLSKAWRRPRPQRRGRGDPKIDSTSVAGFPTVLPSIWSFISMLCWAHPMLLCMQRRFCTRSQISRAASPTGLQREEEYTYRETSLSVIWLGTSPELCVRKVEVIFFPHACSSGRKEKENMIWTWLMLPGHLSADRLVAFGVRLNISRLFHSEVLASRLWKKRVGLKEVRTRKVGELICFP